jgi:glycopeptide antibiotics resistance protein
MGGIRASANPGISPVYYGIAIMIAILTSFIAGHYYRQKRISKTQSAAAVLLITYIFLVFSSTVFSRIPKDYYTYELLPFWSYREIYAGSKDLLWEDVLNIIMLCPMGLLLPMVLDSGRGGTKRIFRMVVLIGFLISLTIELLQLILKRGLFEFDDMFHNTLGVMIGFGLFQCRKNSMKRRKQKRRTN